MISFTLLAALAILYCFTVAIYRLYLSPLSHIPGPKIAALTQYYCAYHDIIKGGRYTFVIEEMHRKYGPIVRTMPDVIHVNDPSFVDKLYPAQSPMHIRERGWTILNLFHSHNSGLATGPHDLHRRRRAVLSKFFSKKDVRQLVGVINSICNDLTRRIEQYAHHSNPVIVVNHALRAATKDVIQDYALGGEGGKCLDKDDLNADIFGIMSPERAVHWNVHFPTMQRAMAKLPKKVIRVLDERMPAFIEWLEGLEVAIDKIRTTKDPLEGRNIFQEIMNSELPAQEKSPERLLDEAMVLAIAGADTTASALTALVYHVCADRQIFERLREELEGAISSPHEAPDPQKLDGLPYLNALIEETLRLYPPATGRQDRLAPNEDLVFEYPGVEKTGGSGVVIIPRGTIMGMSANMLNRHPSLYGDDADDFRPERFIENPKLFRQHLTFSKGGRQCLGMNLAYQELQSFTAGIFRRFSVYDPEVRIQEGASLELYETSVEDVRMFSDYVTPSAYPGSKGVRLKVRV